MGADSNYDRKVAAGQVQVGPTMEQANASLAAAMAR